MTTVTMNSSYPKKKMVSVLKGVCQQDKGGVNGRQ